jgi:SAM-dependent methyltransferase
MFFLNKQSVKDSGFSGGLSQRARASVQVLGAMQDFSSGALRPVARACFENDPDGQAIMARTDVVGVNEPWSARNARTREVCERYPAYLFERFMQRYVAEEVYLTGIPAAFQMQDQLSDYANDFGPDVGGSLELNPDMEKPGYFENDWHIQPGGWDGFDLYGAMFSFIVAPNVFKYGGYAAVGNREDISRNRDDCVAQFPKRDYRNIYEPGCGSASALRALHDRFPKANLVGCDLSTVQLKMGFASANRLGIPVALKQRDAAHTGEADAAFDAVLIYTLLHELPKPAAIAVLQEMYRILEPGGDIVMVDPPPFDAVDAFQANILDWDTENRGEPYFSEACATDWAQVLRDVGFVDVSAYPLTDKGAYPYVNRGSKPL